MVLPLLRPLRLLRLVVLIGVLQKAVGHAIRGKVIVYTISGAILLVYVASLAVLQTERGAPDAHITNFGDALWWAMTTITTVGYGDMYPVTTTGRVIAALLMIGGISLVGSITATIASWIVQTVAVDDAASAAVTAAHINDLRTEIAALRDELRRVPAVDASGSDPDRETWYRVRYQVWRSGLSAGGGTRTHTLFRTRAPKARASSNSATPAES